MPRRGEIAQNRIRLEEWLRLGSTNVLRQRFSKEDGISQAEVHSLSTGRRMNVSSITDEKDDATFTWLSRAKPGESSASDGSVVTEA